MNNIFDALARIHNLRMASEHDLIFHYCSMNTLEAMLDSKKIRFCALPYMNDPLELEYGIQIIRDVVLGFKKNHGSDEGLISAIKENLEFKFSERYRRIYIFCMSQEGDKLPQWRAYGDNGNGCSVGFSISRLMNLPPKNADMTFFLTPLVYKANELAYLQTAMVNLLKKLHLDIKNSHETEALLKTFFNKIAMLPLVVKKFDYAEEFEWRLLLNLSENFWLSTESPEINLAGRPIVQLPIDLLIGEERNFKHVILGPSTAGGALQVDQIRRRASKSRVLIEKISKSTIAYRNNVH